MNPLMTWPVLIALFGAVGVFYSSQISIEKSLSAIRSETDGLSERLDAFASWQIATEDTRFRASDGAEMRMRLEDSLRQHTLQPAHGSVLPAIARIETRLDALEQTMKLHEMP